MGEDGEVVEYKAEEKFDEAYAALVEHPDDDAQVSAELYGVSHGAMRGSTAGHVADEGGEARSWGAVVAVETQGAQEKPRWS